jgi:catecholate siderophore receptor
VLEAPSYWVFNALAAYAVSDRLTLGLNVNNLFNEEYYRVNNNGGRLYPGTTRTYVLKADFAF